MEINYVEVLTNVCEEIEKLIRTKEHYSLMKVGGALVFGTNGLPVFTCDDYVVTLDTVVEHYLHRLSEVISVTNESKKNTTQAMMKLIDAYAYFKGVSKYV